MTTPNQIAHTRAVEQDLLAARASHAPRKVRAAAFAFTAELQPEIWSRGYGFSWGTREEWTDLLLLHPELSDRSAKDVATEILAHLIEWSPLLAAKEARAKAAYMPLPDPDT